MLASSPKGAVVFVLALYLIFLIVWLPLRLVSIVVGEFGTYALLCSGIYYVGFTVASYLSYPASFKTVQRDIEKDYSRRLVQKLDQSVVILASWAGDFRGQAPGPEHAAFRQRFAEAMWIRTEVLHVLRQALHLVGLSRGDNESMAASVSTSDHPGAAKAALTGVCVSPLSLSKEAASDAAQLHRILGDVLAVLEAMEPAAEALAATPNPHAFFSLHAELCGSIFRGPPAPLSGDLAPPPASASSPPGQPPVTLPKLSEALFMHLGRLRLLAPRLRLRAGKDESGFPLGSLRGCLNARKPVTDSCAGIDLMRAEVAARFNCRCFFLRPNPSKNPQLKVDVCVVPPLLNDKDPAGGEPAGGPPAAAAASPRPSAPPHPHALASAPPLPLGVVAAVTPGVPCLVYCNPNAGIYECANMSPKSADWIDFYRGLGFQVVMFNYRGYGRSTGAPSPAANSSDCIALVELLRHPRLRVPHVALHGESIGGMVAAAAARHARRPAANAPAAASLGPASGAAPTESGGGGGGGGGRGALLRETAEAAPLSSSASASSPLSSSSGRSPASSSRPAVDLLVCDRTFGNLGAVAQYLVGGWTVPALRLFTQWDTDVVQNFALAECPKLVCSDVDDEIIAEPGSLKAGLALLCELGDGALTKPDLPFSYALAELLSEPLPSPAPPLPPLPADSRAASLSVPVTEAQVVHFAQCLRRVARQARAADKATAAKAARGSSSGSVGSKHFSAGGGGARTAVRRSLTGSSGSGSMDLESGGDPSGSSSSSNNAYTTKDAMRVQGNWGRLQQFGGSRTPGPTHASGGGVSPILDDGEFDDCSDDNEGGGGDDPLGLCGGGGGEEKSGGVRPPLHSSPSGEQGGSAFEQEEEEEEGKAYGETKGGSADEWQWALESAGVGLREDPDEDAAARGGGGGGAPRASWAASLATEPHPQGAGGGGAAAAPWLTRGHPQQQSASAVARAWWVCARVDGRCGQLLGHAAAKGHPWVRAWVASLLVWHGGCRVTELPGCDPFLDLKARGDPRFLSVEEACDGLDELLREAASSSSSSSSSSSASSVAGAAGAATQQRERQPASPSGAAGVGANPATGNVSSESANHQSAVAAPRLSIKEIKATLSLRGVSFADCNERRELEDLLASSAGSTSTSSCGQAQSRCLSGSDLDDVRYLAHFLRFLHLRTFARHLSAGEEEEGGGGDGAERTRRPPPLPLSKAASALAEKRCSSSSSTSSAFEASALELGALIPLHCGHNAAFSEAEKRMLEHHFVRIMGAWRSEGDVTDLPI